MNCPDINRLIDLAESPEADREIRDHLEDCGTCRATLALIRELPAAYRPEMEVPEELVQKTLGAVFGLEPVTPSPVFVPLHALIAGTLGAVTVVLGIALSGSVGSGGSKELLLFSLGAGLAAALYEVRAIKRAGHL